MGRERVRERGRDHRAGEPEPGPGTFVKCQKIVEEETHRPLGVLPTPGAIGL